MNRREVIEQFIPRSPLVGHLASYLTAARGHDLTAHAMVTRRGRGMVFSEVKVTEPAGRLVATGSVVPRLGRNQV